jgi:hypothetical protein
MVMTNNKICIVEEVPITIKNGLLPLLEDKKTLHQSWKSWLTELDGEYLA